MKGLRLGSMVYVWREPVSRATIALRSGTALVQKILNGFLVALLILSVVFFSLGVFLLSDPSSFLQAKTWLTPNIYLLSFWVSVVLAQILFFRRIALREKTGALPKLDPASLQALAVEEISETERTEDLFSVFAPSARRAVEETYETAVRFRSRDVSPVHFFLGALSSQDAAQVFGRLGLTFDQIKDPLLRQLSAQPTGPSPTFGMQAQETLAKAGIEALAHGREHVMPVEILMAAFDSDPFLQELLFSRKIERQDFENVVHWARIHDELVRRSHEFARAAAHKPKGAMNRAYTSLATPYLDSVSEDLTRAAAYGRLPMLVGRDQEVNAVLRAIEGGLQSVVLVGQPGVGKEAILFGLAERMVEERVPKQLQDKRLVKISLPHIVSGATGTEAEARLLRVLREIGMSGNIITVITDIDQMIGAGLDLSSILAGELDRHYTFVIATTTPEGYTSRVERSGLGQKLVKITIEEPAQNDAILVLESKVGMIEAQQHVSFTYQALSALVTLTHRYIHERFLPEKAIEVAQEVALSVREGRGEQGLVTAEDVAAIVSEKSHVPVTEVASDERETLLTMESRLHDRVIGQEEAISAIAAALRRARTALRSEDRPIATFLFLGPTGVGKTELAKTVSEVYFGSEDAMLRFDMSEFQGTDAAERLIGGAGRAGLLTEAVRQKPFALLLLDEFEKAHSEALNLFLQVMDDGRLTDGLGRMVDFTNVILIATSNAGSQDIQDAVRAGATTEAIKEQLLNTTLRSSYRPELLNRFDGVIVFKPLGMDEVVQITYLLLNKVSERLKAKGVLFQPEDQAVYELAQKGYDPQFGARPLRRVIQETVDNAIANLLLKGEVGRRDTIVLKPGGAVEVEKAKSL